MTVFPDGTKERLHGHNYFVALTLELSDVSFERFIPFGVVKKRLGELCLEWKERTLVATKNPFFEELRDADGEYEFRLCGKRYVLPREDVLLLPIDNISVESLAGHLSEELLVRLGSLVTDAVVGLEFEVSEVPGQGASTIIDLAARRAAASS